MNQAYLYTRPIAKEMFRKMIRHLKINMRNFAYKVSLKKGKGVRFHCNCNSVNSHSNRETV